MIALNPHTAKINTGQYQTGTTPSKNNINMIVPWNDAMQTGHPIVGFSAHVGSFFSSHSPGLPNISPSWKA